MSERLQGRLRADAKGLLHVALAVLLPPCLLGGDLQRHVTAQEDGAKYQGNPLRRYGLFLSTSQGADNTQSARSGAFPQATTFERAVPSDGLLGTFVCLSTEYVPI